MNAPAKHNTHSVDQALIECAGPNGEIYKFDSRMIMAEDSHALMTGNQSRDSFSAGSEGSNNYSLKDLPHQQYISLSVNNVILQATHLRNTDWLIGVAVYTGNDTKIGQNKSHPPIKWTQMDRFVNKLVAFVFIFQLLIVIVLGVLGNVWSVYFTSEVRAPIAASIKTVTNTCISTGTSITSQV